MRKADYSLLADIIKREIEEGEAVIRHGEHNLYRRDTGVSQRDTAVRIAIVFASSSSVDRNAFLLACGIDPRFTI